MDIDTDPARAPHGRMDSLPAAAHALAVRKSAGRT